jgi:hypothetical protein
MQYLVALLVLLTLTLLLWHRFGMERVIELSPLHPHEVSVYDDHDESSQASDQPDNSVATLEKSADALTMHCRLGRALSWPYCKFRFVTGHDDKGIDLSEFDTISLDLRYDVRCRARSSCSSSIPNRSRPRSGTGAGRATTSWNLPCRRKAR